MGWRTHLHLIAAICAVATAVPAGADPAHGISMYGRPALPPDFVSLPYADPDAPKGGSIRFGEPGGFDSLNPFILKGRAPYDLTAYTVETLMARSIDEPFALYGLLAESVQTDEARSYVAFTLREGARFSDGKPVTVEDVLWSFETLGTAGSPPNPRYSATWAKIARAEATGPRTVRFTFTEPDRELPLIMGLRPVLEKAQWQGRDFAATSLIAPTGSGPYVVAAFEPGRFISYRKNPDWWGRDLPVNRGRWNFDEIRTDYYGDGDVLAEAFRAGEITTYREPSATRWATGYDFPAVRSGEVVKSEIPHHRPSGIEGFVMNTRRPIFADWRVRDALILAFDADLIGKTLEGPDAVRIASYFGNSDLAMTPGTPATGKVLALLRPFATDLIPGTIEGYSVPTSEGSNRRNLRAATKELADAGWTNDGGTLKDAAGEPFRFEILLTNGSGTTGAIASIYVEALKRLGIEARITSVDSAQAKARTDAYDFDMTWMIRNMSLSPGNEQMLYWGAAGVDSPGSRNLMGMDVPAAEAMIAAMLSSTDREDFVAATQALDRILTAGRYVVPFWFSKVGRIAHAGALHFPDRIPVYGDWPGFQPDVWWYEAP